MSPIRRELLNGVFVLVVASLLSVAFSAFQVRFNAQLWVLILMGVAIAVSGYVVFEIALRFMAASVESTRQREEEWLKRVGRPARLELGMGGTAGIAGAALLVDAAKTLKPGSDVTVLLYLGPEGGRERAVTDEARKLAFGAYMEQLR